MTNSSTNKPPIERRISTCGILVTVGLLIQITALLWSHPLAFVVFLAIGTPVVTGGALLYLYTLVQEPEGK
jgi:hypothetical protein